MTHGEAGKGDRPRPCNRKRYEENYERIFRNNSKRTKPSDRTRTGKKNNDIS